VLAVTFFHADSKVGAFQVPGLFLGVEDRPTSVRGTRGLYGKHSRGEDLLATRSTRTLHAWQIAYESIRGTWDVRVEAAR
jgi:hypothetical protein